MIEFLKYPKIVRISKREVDGILDDEVVVQEKIDGSNVQIRRVNGRTAIGSRNRWIDIGSKQFKALFPFMEEKDFSTLPDDIMLFGEYLWNQCTVKYEKKSPFVLFDVVRILENDELDFLGWEATVEYSKKYGLELIPLLYMGKATTSQLKKLREDTKSAFGGPAEGIIIKNYFRRNVYGRPFFAKMLNPEFEECFKKNSKMENKNDIKVKILNKFLTDMRIKKSIYKLEDEDKIMGDMPDLGFIIPEVQNDILDEEKEEIKNMLFDFEWPRISRLMGRVVARRYRAFLDEV